MEGDREPVRGSSGAGRRGRRDRPPQGAPLAIEVERRFPLTVGEGFDFITDLRNRPDYWRRLVRVDPASRWHEPGDRASVALRRPGWRAGFDRLAVRRAIARTAGETMDNLGRCLRAG